MAGLSDSRLRTILLGALPGARVQRDHGHTKPIILDIPNLGLVRIYLWTTTPDASAQGRPLGEHKAQIILPGTSRGSRQILDLAEIPTALLGYSPLFGVFTAWQPERHANSGYSKNLQFREELLDRARALGWAVGDIRTTQSGPEIRVAVHPLHLPHYLETMRNADTRRLQGEERRAFMLLSAPRVHALNPTEDKFREPEREQERERVMAARMRRSSGFARTILADYASACAVCSLQLSIVEGAHIIPVHDSRSRDERWNGICLCPNHHSLYDSRIVRIDANATVRVVNEDVDLLRQLNLLQGYDDAISPFVDRPIRLPRFAQTDQQMFERMLEAFRIVYLS